MQFVFVALLGVLLSCETSNGVAVASQHRGAGHHQEPKPLPNIEDAKPTAGRSISDTAVVDTPQSEAEPTDGISFLQESASLVVPSPADPPAFVHAKPLAEAVALVGQAAARTPLIRREAGAAAKHGAQGTGRAWERLPMMGAVSLLATGASWVWGDSSDEAPKSGSGSSDGSEHLEDLEAFDVASMAFPEAAVEGIAGEGVQARDSERANAPVNSARQAVLPVRDVPTVSSAVTGIIVVPLVVAFVFWIGSSVRQALRRPAVKPLEIDAFVTGGITKVAYQRQMARAPSLPGKCLPVSLNEWVSALPLTCASEVDRSACCGFYDHSTSKPMSGASSRVVRLQGVVHGPVAGAVLHAPLSGQECVMYSSAVSRRADSKDQAKVVAAAAGATNFIVNLQAAEKETQLEVASDEALLFDMFWGKFSAVRMLADTPNEWKTFVSKHEANHGKGQGQLAEEHLVFQEHALLIGTKVTLVGELHRSPTGALSLQPIRGGDLVFSTERRATSQTTGKCDEQAPSPESRRTLVVDPGNSAEGGDNTVEASGCVLVSDAPTLLAPGLCIEVEGG